MQVAHESLMNRMCPQKKRMVNKVNLLSCIPLIDLFGLDYYFPWPLLLFPNLAAIPFLFFFFPTRQQGKVDEGG